MNAFFIKLSAVFTPIRPLIRLTIFATALALVYLFFSQNLTLQQRFLEPCLLLLLWSVWLNFLVVSFQPEVESLPRKTGFFTGIKDKISKLFTFIFSVAFLVLTLATAYFTFRLLNL